ncbi:MAG: hypothetical protein AB7N71_14515, partial [Phycisphaerae bacterium]
PSRRAVRHVIHAEDTGAGFDTITVVSRNDRYSTPDAELQMPDRNLPARGYLSARVFYFLPLPR